MPRITADIVIERPAADVWAVVADPATHTDWRPALEEFRVVSDGPLAVGSRIHEVIRFRNRPIAIDDVVTALEPERRFSYAGSWEAASFPFDILLAPIDGGTRVTFDWDLQPRSVLLKLAAPLMGRSMRKATVEELELLKAYVEGRAGAKR